MTQDNQDNALTLEFTVRMLALAEKAATLIPPAEIHSGLQAVAISFAMGQGISPAELALQLHCVAQRLDEAAVEYASRTLN